MIYPHQLNRTPNSAATQLQAVAELLQQTLEETLLGLILHGSAASAGFDDERSDLDVLAIIDGPLTPMQRETLGKTMATISNDPYPLEISIVEEQDLDKWVYPCKHQFHYGEDLREQFAEGRYEPETATDEDLAAHFTMARARGVDLLGTYPLERLPVVPRGDYLRALLSDAEWAHSQREKLGDYAFANACRTIAYLDSGELLSKSEGIEWCRKNKIDLSSVVDNARKKLRLELGL